MEGGPRRAVDDVMISVIIPTYNRRSLVQEAMEALAQVERPWPVELVVVVDGSTDGTYEAASALPMPFPTRVVQQQNGGAAQARNHGAELAVGRYLLFLDDDMIVAPDILVHHERRLSDGMDAVVGHMPVHPESPDGLLKHAVTTWADERRDRLASSAGRVTISDLLTGQLSVRAQLFREVGGFDSDFTEDGTFGGEDTDFGLRLQAAGSRFAYESRAVSYQKYIVTPRQYLRQWADAGRGDALLIRKHPETRAELMARHRGLLQRSVFRFGPRLAPAAVRARFVDEVLARIDQGRADRFTGFAFLAIRESRYWASFDAEAHKGPGHGLRVLAYHQVEPGQAASTPYAVTTTQLESHLAALRAAGFRFIDADEYLLGLESGTSGGRDVLVTFDDGYADLVEEAAPVLERFGVRPVVFVVSGLVGRWNAWDRPEAEGTPLLGAAGLRDLRERGWEIGSHTRTHAHLGQLGPAALREELESPVRDLLAAGLPAPRMLAYPYGEQTAFVRRRAARAGYRLAFALRTTAADPAPDRAMAVPRIEVGRDTTAAGLLDQLRAPSVEPRLARARVELRGVLSVLRATLTAKGERSEAAVSEPSSG